MNRELKFRVWDNDVKRFRSKEAMDSSVLMLNYGMMHGTIKHPTEKVYYADAVIQQFTGQVDINDKEIYEGDIVKLIKGDGYGWYSQKNFEVKFGEYNCPFGEGNVGDIEHGYYAEGTLRNIVSLGSANEIFEIVGNIFENPELLK